MVWQTALLGVAFQRLDLRRTRRSPCPSPARRRRRGCRRSAAGRAPRSSSSGSAGSMSAPGLVGVGHQLAVRPARPWPAPGRPACAVRFSGAVGLRIGQHDAVVADLDLGDLGDAVLARRSRVPLSLMAREALAMSGMSTPTPAQNSLMPPPVPVDSTTGVLKLAGLAELLGDRGGERKYGARIRRCGSGRGPALRRRGRAWQAPLG